MYCFNKLEKEKALNLSPVVLAFVGDSVYSLYVRNKLVCSTDLKSGRLTSMTSGVVNAKAQAEFIDKIMDKLSDEELAIFKRGRNTKKPYHAKNASVSDYNKATGFEAVIGYLYLIDDIDRLNYILGLGENNEG